MNKIPDMTQWLKEAKAHRDAGQVGMYLTHNGVVRQTSRASVREGTPAGLVVAMEFSFDREAVARAEEQARAMEGVWYVRTWLNSGRLQVGDDIMYVLVGGDTRPHTVSALEALVTSLKTSCVQEREVFG